MKRLLSILAIPFFVAACGGGGSGSTNADASGFWSDPTEDDTGILITKSGEIWGVALTSPYYTLLKGSATTSGSTLSFSGTRYDGNTSAQISGTGQVAPKATLKGSSTLNGTTTQFSLVYDSTYEITPTTASIAGAYSISSGGTVTIASSGNLSGNISGCILSGTVTPAVNENFFRLSVSYDQATCQTNVPATGVLVKSGAYLIGGAVAGAEGDAFVLTKK